VNTFLDAIRAGKNPRGDRGFPEGQGMRGQDFGPEGHLKLWGKPNREKLSSPREEDGHQRRNTLKAEERQEEGPDFFSKR